MEILEIVEQKKQRYDTIRLQSKGRHTPRVT